MLKSVWKALGYFRMSFFLILVAGFIFAPTIYSQSWGNTNLMTTVGNVLYTTEPDGNLYRTEITTGVKTAVGKGFQSEKFLFSNGTNLYSITAGGDIRKHFPSTTIASRNWINTRLLTTDSAFLYTIETDGSLYRTDLISGVKTRIGTNTWPGAKLFFVQAGTIVIIGYPQLYGVNPSTGQMAPAGPANLLSGTRLGANVVDDFYSIESSGLYRTSTTTGQPVKTKVVAAWAAAKFLFSIGNELWLISNDGLLYRIALSDGGYSKRFPAPGPTPTPTSTPITEVNVALRKPAIQSSNIGGGYDASLGLASNAVDGNTDGRWGSGSVTHTALARTANPFWQVDLGADYDINKIQIWNRTDCCSQELTNFKIWTKTATGNWDVFYPGLKTYTPGETYPLTFIGNKQARYVHVKIDSPSAVLMLAEVKVFGTPAGPVVTSNPTPPTPTISPTQSTGAGKAVSSEEEQLWAEVEKVGTVKAYQKYLTEYKNGKYAKTAQTRIDLSSDTSAKPDTTPTNVNTAKTEEDQYWDEVEKIDTVIAYQAYIDKYPLGKYVGKALLRKQLKSGISATPTPAPIATPTPLPKVSADDELWNKIKDSSRVADFEVYLQVFPNGDHKGDAMLNISRLKPEKKEPEKKPEPEKPIMCTVNAEVNLRDDSKKKILGILKRGRVVVSIEQDGDWERVGEIRNGSIISLGWVSYKFLTCEGDEP